MHFILGEKPKDHKFLYNRVAQSLVHWHEEIDEKGHHHTFKFLNQIPLNKSHLNCNRTYAL